MNLTLTTTDQVLLIILVVILCLFFLMGIIAVFGVIKLISTARRVAEKAEGVVDSVEEAAEVFKSTSGKLTLFKLAKNIFNATQKRSRK